MAHIEKCSTGNALSMAHIENAPLIFALSVEHIAKCATDNIICGAFPNKCATDKNSIYKPFPTSVVSTCMQAVAELKVLRSSIIFMLGNPVGLPMEEATRMRLWKIFKGNDEV